jgi:PDZ domain-containing secreted protein
MEGVFINELDTTNTNPASNFLQLNDIITHVDGVPIGMYNTQYPFFTAIHLKQAGTAISITYSRVVDDVRTSVTVPGIILASFPDENDRFFYGVH